jgi:hypothetical protein
MFMESSRDSSIWRSLAVAFGDGVAFGVGVKLAQGPVRPAVGAPAPASAPSPEFQTLPGRLEQIEQRLSSIEQAPPPSIAPESAPAPFDQKVLEAVVNALDARLREQSGQVERRLTELEAKLAIELKTLERQDSIIAKGLEKRLDDAHGQYNEHVTAIRDAVAEDMDILYSQVAKTRDGAAEVARQAANSAIGDALGQSLDTRISAAVTALVTAQLQSRLESSEQRMSTSIQEAMERAGRTSTAETVRLDGEISLIRSALAEKDREIAELRQRIADADQSVLDLILAMGQMCRQVAERISAPAAETRNAAPPPPNDNPPVDAAPPASPSAGAPPPPDEPKLEAFAAEDGSPKPAVTVAAKGLNGHTTIDPIPAAAAEEAAPAFGSTQRPSRLWRIPLVSSFLILATGSLHLLR